MRFYILAFIFIPICIAAQPYPQNYFRSPLDIELVLSGNFAEIRPNHFHAGLDFKTEGVEGKNIYAAADGYVSRISISPTGYGKAIYIDHPNGYTTVYAHLKTLNKSIGEYTYKEQYRKEKFKINIYPKPNELPVKKGEIIGLSGNSGSSGGPHLHFEIRDTESEHPNNPLLFGLPVKDNVRPSIFTLYAYPRDKSASIDGRNQKKSFAVVGSNGKYRLAKPLTLKGKIGFGLKTHDFLNGSGNRCGVYSIAMLIDNQPFYSMKMNEHSFDETRYINAHIDYVQRQQTRTKIHKTFILSNNKLRIYDKSYGNGIFNFKGKHNVNFTVFDAYGNKSSLKFTTKLPNKAILSSSKDTLNLFRCKETNYLIKDDVRIIFPKDCFYEDFNFKYSIGKQVTERYSKLYTVHNLYTPVQKKFHLSIRPEGLPERLKDKAIIIRFDKRGRKRAYHSNWINGFLNAKVKNFGKFCIMTDEIAPEITPLKGTQQKRKKKGSNLRFKISDNLSGIKHIKATINGDWLLYDWDPKRRLLTVKLDKRLIKKSDIEFILYIEDGVGNHHIFKKSYEII